MYMAFGVVMWGGFAVGKYTIINWCFCKQDPNGNWKPHLFRTVLIKTKKKSGKTVIKSGENQGISWDKKSGNPACNFAKIAICTAINNSSRYFNLCAVLHSLCQNYMHKTSNIKITH